MTKRSSYSHAEGGGRIVLVPAYDLKSSHLVKIMASLELRTKIWRGEKGLNHISKITVSYNLIGYSSVGNKEFSLELGI